MLELSAEELRRLKAPSTLWLRQPTELNYATLLPRLPPRRRLLPKSLRLAKLAKLDLASDIQLPEPHEDQEAAEG